MKLSSSDSGFMVIPERLFVPRFSDGSAVFLRRRPANRTKNILVQDFLKITFAHTGGSRAPISLWFGLCRRGFLLSFLTALLKTDRERGVGLWQQSLIGF